MYISQLVRVYTLYSYLEFTELGCCSLDDIASEFNSLYKKLFYPRKQ